jgi:hypothetical protein
VCPSYRARVGGGRGKEQEGIPAIGVEVVTLAPFKDSHQVGDRLEGTSASTCTSQRGHPSSSPIAGNSIDLVGITSAPKLRNRASSDSVATSRPGRWSATASRVLHSEPPRVPLVLERVLIEAPASRGTGPGYLVRKGSHYPTRPHIGYLNRSGPSITSGPIKTRSEYELRNISDTTGRRGGHPHTLGVRHRDCESRAQAHPAAPLHIDVAVRLLR